MSLQYAYATRLSDHLALTPEGYLIATACVLARSGPQQYRRSEIDTSSSSDSLVTVNRPVEEVTAPKFLASLAGKSFVVTHPAAMITADSHSWSTRGTVLRAYVGNEFDPDGNTLILGDIVIHDPTAIQRILAGERQLSVGYVYDLEESSDGSFEMRDLIANHVALVARGRAGNAMIVDGEMHLPPEGGVTFSETEDEDLFPMTKTKDTEPNARLDRLCTLLEKLLASKTESGDVEATDEGELISVETLPRSERGTNPVVDALRVLKPFIQASGNRRAIDSYNRAITEAKKGNIGPAERLIAACDRLEPEGSFQAAVDRRRRELLGEPEPNSGHRHAEDRQPKTETYQEQVDRVRRKMLSAK